MHATAVKTNPAVGLLRLGMANGHGAECASVGEVQHSLRIGFAAKDVVFDSPCKTEAEIDYSLTEGVHLNIDNLQELARVVSLPWTHNPAHVSASVRVVARGTCCT